MCGKSNNAMRDREFDSSVRADIDASQATGVVADYGITRPKVSCAELHREAAANQQAGQPNDDTPVTIVDDEVGSQTAQPNMLSGAHAALAEVLSSGSVSEAMAKANEYVNGILAPYYLKRGDFDHVEFINDLEVAKGSKLSEPELRFFGHVIGSYCGNKAAQEYVAAIESGDLNEAIAIQRAVTARPSAPV